MSHDVVIVGAGAAGCVLACRLSEDRSRSVMLLEAGPDYPDIASLPPEILSAASPAHTHDWGYRSEPGRLGRALRLPRGKLVGGCSATNAAAALRGAPADYDAWAAAGNPGWSFSEVLPFFRLLESDADFRTDWHGQDGPLPIERTELGALTAVHRAFLEACWASGFPRVNDHNAPGAAGAGPIPMNTRAGVRQSTALTYLARARGRPNLTIRVDAAVHRVLFSGRRATGVELAPSGESIRGGHVILAAGTYGSPVILLRSGIGPAGHLKEIGVPVREDLDGVGRGLRDHPLLGLRFSALPPVPPAPFFGSLLTLASGQGGTGHDVQILPSSVLATDAGRSTTRAHFMAFVSIVKPISTGNLSLRSADAADPPCIDPGYFADPADMPRMIDAVRTARRLSRTPEFTRLQAEELYPGVDVTDSEPDLRAAVLARVETYHHPVGTCRMGPAGDPRAVVDSRCRVHGVEKLSVVDASVMPVIPAANTHLPVIMTAERCASWLSEA